MRSTTMSNRMIRATVIAAIVVGAFASKASAQTLEAPRARQGYYLTAGLGALGSLANDKGRDRGPWLGNVTTLRAGQLVTSRFGLGLDIEFGGATHEGRTAQLAGLAIEGNVALAGNLALRGLAGFGVLALRHKSEEGYGTRGTSGGFYGVAASYDFFPWHKRLSGGWSITPVVEMRVLPGETVKGYVGSFALEIGWWSGLPKNQLELSPDEAWKKKR